MGWVSGNKEGADMQEAERFQMETAKQKHRGQKAQGTEGGQLGAEAPGSLGSTLQCEPRTASRIPARFSLSPHSCWCQNCLRGHSCLLPTLSWDWPTLMGPGSRK